MSGEFPPPAAWYPDPAGSGGLRYWDGNTWTGHTAPVPPTEPATEQPPAEAGAATEPGHRDGEVLEVTRGRVYGNEMLYVNLPDGTRVGRLNLTSGRVTVEQPELSQAFIAAIDQWLDRVARPDDGSGGGESFDEGPGMGSGDGSGIADGDQQGHASEKNDDGGEHLGSDAGGPVGAPTGGPVTDGGRSAETELPSQPADQQRAWRDLGANLAGQAAREEAVRLRKQAPVKTFVARVLGQKTDERAWRIGADGEEDVAWRLRKLGDAWSVLHAVPVGERGSDIDHVVVGPGGVYTLNTKHHPNGKVWVAERTLMVNGTKTNYLRSSRFEASRASQRLGAACGVEVAVEPVIVVIAKELTIKAQPSDVHVVGRRHIVDWLLARPQVLDDGMVTRIYDQARRNTTWLGS